MLVKEVMHSIDVKLSPKQSALEAWQLIREHNVIGLPVQNSQSKYIGILTRNNIIEAGPEILNGHATVTSIMTDSVYVLNDHTTLANVWALHGEVFPIVNKDNEMIGVLDKNSVCHELLNKANWILLQVETILDSVNNGIIAINNQGIVSLYNQSAEKITRRPKSYAMGRHLSEVIIPQGLLDVLKEGKCQSQHKISITYTNGDRTYVTNRSLIYENKIYILELTLCH